MTVQNNKVVLLFPGSLADLFSRAAKILEKRGIAKGVTILPDGRVDIFGAVLLAANARGLSAGDVDPERSGVPSALIPLVLEAYEMLYGLSEDLDAWMDEPIVSTAEGVALLLEAEDLARVSIWRRNAGRHDEPVSATKEALEIIDPY
jgi:hypothetical protein